MLSQPRMQFTLTLTKDDGGVLVTKSRKKRRISLRTCENGWQKASLRVTYLKDEGEIGRNEGDYYNPDDLRDALAAFTEAELLDFIANPQGTGG